MKLAWRSWRSWRTVGGLRGCIVDAASCLDGEKCAGAGVACWSLNVWTAGLLVSGLGVLNEWR